MLGRPVGALQVVGRPVGAWQVAGRPMGAWQVARLARHARGTRRVSSTMQGPT